MTIFISIVRLLMLLRVSAKFSSVLFFVEKHSCLLQITDDTNDTVSLDKLLTEFTLYQTPVDKMDIQQHMISQIQDVQDNYKYKTLARVMSAILAVPHSNADRILLLRKTRTKAKSTMTNETLEALLIQKVASIHIEPRHS